MSESIPTAPPVVVVTGANGLVGSHVCVALAERGATVRAVVRRPGTAPDLAGVEERVGEFTELIIPGQGVPGRPTVQIRGRGAEARTDALMPERARRRPPRTVSERLGPRPDRVALYALLLAVVLIITAVATADASTL